MVTEEEVKSKTIERFWKKIKFSEPNECWIWQACLGTRNTSLFKITENGKAKTEKGTRFMYRAVFGDFDPKLCVLHNCPDGDNPKCINPNHFWLGTKSENTADRERKGRGAKGEKIWTAKLKVSQVIEIRKRADVNESPNVISRDYGISASVVSNIKARRIWKSIKEVSL